MILVSHKPSTLTQFLESLSVGIVTFCDIRQGFNLSFVGESPPRLKSRLADALVGSWKLAPILVMHSGTWFNPSTGTYTS